MYFTLNQIWNFLLCLLANFGNDRILKLSVTESHPFDRFVRVISSKDAGHLKILTWIQSLLWVSDDGGMHFMMCNYFSSVTSLICNSDWMVSRPIWKSQHKNLQSWTIIQMSVSNFKYMELTIFNICHMGYESWTNIDIFQPWWAKWMTDNWYKQARKPRSYASSKLQPIDGASDIMV